MRFRTQIISFGAAAVLLLGLTGGIGVLSNQQLGHAFGSSMAANEAMASSQHADMMHDAIRGDAQLAVIGMLTKTPERVAEAEKGFKEHVEAFNSEISKLQALPLTDESRAALSAVAPLVKSYTETTERAIRAFKTEGTSAEKELEALQQSFSALETRMAALSESIEKAGLQTSADAIQQVDRTLVLVSVVVVLATLALFALGLVVTRATMRQMGGEPREAAALAQSVAAGDLSTHIDVDPADATSMMAQLKSMQFHLASVVRHVRENADGVATASAEIAQGNADLSSRTEQQASALEETAASMEELSSTVKQNADNARQGNQLAISASAVAVRGGEVVGQVVQTMKGINDSSRKIADILSVIDGIAFQTNILALNAAVEAARAGEQGRGFAVVASEVRSLAGRSADAAKEIKGLISDSVDRVTQGSALVDQAGATMTEVVSAIRRVADIMGEISAASGEQSAGVAQVGEAVTQMDHATQQNAALVEQSAAAAENLKAQAQQLVQAVAVFKLGQAVQAPAPSVPPSHAIAAQAPAKTFPAVERRGPARSKNVARLGARTPAPPSASPPAEPPVLTSRVETRKAVANGGDEEWTTF